MCSVGTSIIFSPYYFLINNLFQHILRQLSNMILNHFSHSSKPNFIFLRCYSYLKQSYSKRIYVYPKRLAYSTSNDSGSHPGAGNRKSRTPNRVAAQEAHLHHVPAPVVVPEVWPKVPLISVNRNPLFPRFIKLVEVCSWINSLSKMSFKFEIDFPLQISSPALSNLIRRKIQLNQPYAGVFLRKNDDYELVFKQFYYLIFFIDYYYIIIFTTYFLLLSDI